MQVSLVTIFHDANVLKCVFERGQKMRERNKKLGRKKIQKKKKKKIDFFVVLSLLSFIYLLILGS